MLLSAAGTATAGGKSQSSSKNSKDCGDSRGGRDDRDDRDCRNDRDDDRDDDRNCPKPPTPVPVSGSVSLTPSGSITTSGASVQVAVPYTAPANSGAVLKLLKDGVVVATVSVPSNVTSGSVAFTVDISTVTGATVLQAQLTFNTTTTSGSSGGDCDGRSGRGRDCDDRDDRHCGSGGSTTTTTTLLSPTLTVNRQTNGGGGQSG